MDHQRPQEDKEYNMQPPSQVQHMSLFDMVPQTYQVPRDVAYFSQQQNRGMGANTSMPAGVLSHNLGFSRDQQQQNRPRNLSQYGAPVIFTQQYDDQPHDASLQSSNITYKGSPGVVNPNDATSGASESQEQYQGADQMTQKHCQGTNQMTQEPYQETNQVTPQHQNDDHLFSNMGVRHGNCRGSAGEVMPNGTTQSQKHDQGTQRHTPGTSSINPISMDKSKVKQSKVENKDSGDCVVHPRRRFMSPACQEVYDRCYALFHPGFHQSCGKPAGYESEANTEMKVNSGVAWKNVQNAIVDKQDSKKRGRKCKDENKTKHTVKKRKVVSNDKENFAPSEEKVAIAKCTPLSLLTKSSTEATTSMASNPMKTASDSLMVVSNDSAETGSDAKPKERNDRTATSPLYKGEKIKDNKKSATETDDHHGMHAQKTETVDETVATTSVPAVCDQETIKNVMMPILDKIVALDESVLFREPVDGNIVTVSCHVPLLHSVCNS